MEMLNILETETEHQLSSKKLKTLVSNCACLDSMYISLLSHLAALSLWVVIE